MFEDEAKRIAPPEGIRAVHCHVYSNAIGAKLTAIIGKPPHRPGLTALIEATSKPHMETRINLIFKADTIVLGIVIRVDQLDSKYNVLCALLPRNDTQAHGKFCRECVGF